MRNINWKKVVDSKQVVDDVEKLGQMLESGALISPACTKIDGVDVCLFDTAEVKKFVVNARAEIENCI